MPVLTFLDVVVTPKASDIQAVRNSVGLARIDLGSQMRLIFSEKYESAGGLAALDALEQAVTEARAFLTADQAVFA